MLTARAHLIRLYPDASQAAFLRRAIGCARFAYNYAVERISKDIEAGNPVDCLAYKKQFNAEKKEKWPWIYESPKDANQQPFSNAAKAVSRWKAGKGGRPTFHKKGSSGSFYLSNDKFELEPFKLFMPKLDKPIRMSEVLRFDGKLQSCTISERSGKFYASVSMVIELTDAVDNASVVGVDVGVKTLAVASDGSVCENPKTLRRCQKKIAHHQRAIARRQKGSRRRAKSMKRLGSVHERARNIRNDAIHKFTTALAKNHGTAVIETLSIKGMTRGYRSLRRAVSEASMGEVHRQLLYKMARVAKAPRFFASTKTCSGCGGRLEDITLATRTIHCPHCGLVKDRDINASENLRQWHLRGAPAH